MHSELMTARVIPQSIFRGARFIGYETGGHLWVGHQQEMTDEIASFLKSPCGARRKVSRNHFRRDMDQTYLLVLQPHRNKADDIRRQGRRPSAAVSVKDTEAAKATTRSQLLTNLHRRACTGSFSAVPDVRPTASRSECAKDSRGIQPRLSFRHHRDNGVPRRCRTGSMQSVGKKYVRACTGCLLFGQRKADDQSSHDVTDLKSFFGLLGCVL